jgi:hypothetical protein
MDAGARRVMMLDTRLNAEIFIKKKHAAMRCWPRKAECGDHSALTEGRKSPWGRCEIAAAPFSPQRHKDSKYCKKMTLPVTRKCIL